MRRRWLWSPGCSQPRLFAAKSRRPLDARRAVPDGLQRQPVEIQHQRQRSQQPLPQLPRRRGRPSIVSVGQDRRARVERARLRQREQPLDVVVHAFEPGRVPRPDLGQRPAARVGAFEAIEAQRAGRSCGRSCRRLPPARRRAAAVPRPSRAARRRRGPAIDAPCGSTTNSGTPRRPASPATDR